MDLNERVEWRREGRKEGKRKGRREKRKSPKSGKFINKVLGFKDEGEERWKMRSKGRFLWALLKSFIWK